MVVGHCTSVHDHQRKCYVYMTKRRNREIMLAITYALNLRQKAKWRVLWGGTLLVKQPLAAWEWRLVWSRALRISIWRLGTGHFQVMLWVSRCHKERRATRLVGWLRSALRLWQRK